jgi:hypothetical protein
MARQIINIGTNANDGTGDPLRTAFDKINDNFLELYGADGDANTLQSNLDVNGWNIVSTRSNEDIRIIPNGTGTVELEKSTNITGALTVSTTAGITGNTTIGGTLGVTGLSTLASFKGATGATVTAILDEDTMTSDSATALATQQSIKAYVDSQVTAQDLDFACDDSTALSIDLDSEALQFSGGTGITTTGSGNTVTIAIDGTVTTLTGSQTLTNKILTAPVMTSVDINSGAIDGTTIGASSAAAGTFTNLTATSSAVIDGVTISDNKITTNSSNANLQLSGNANGSVEIMDGLVGTFDIVHNGNIINAGTIKTTGSIIASRIITDASDQNIFLNPSGAGNIIMGATMYTANVETTGVYNIDGSIYMNDKLKLQNDTISTLQTNGGINITANGTGAILLNAVQTASNGTLSANQLQANNYLETTLIRTQYSNTDLRLAPQGVGRVRIEGTGLEVDSIRSTTSNTDLSIATQGTATIDFGTPTQGSVGASTGATALPGNPVGFLKFKLNGTDIVVPYWNAS